MQLLGVRFHNLTTVEAADHIENFIRGGRPRLVLARNAAIRVMEERDPWFRQVYEASDLVTVDGMAFVYLGKALGSPFKEMTGGPALWYELLGRAAQKGYGVFLLGASPQVLQSALAKLKRHYPGLHIVGHHHGYFSSEREEQIVAAIQSAQPQILMVGTSSPMKEKFLQRNLQRLGVPACVGVGGAIDLFAGNLGLAPQWMRWLCLEWMYRVWQEPRRLARRYLVSNTRFLLLVVRHLAGFGQPGSASAE